ncbi:MAG: hypothetical protein V2A77_00635 [Pseudomonadota bacterium]
MLSLLAPAAVAVFLFVLQMTLLAGLQLDLLTPILVYVALDGSLAGAVLFALMLGFLGDTMSGVSNGLDMASGLGVVLMARMLRRHLLVSSDVVRVVAVAVCLLARSLLLLTLVTMTGLPAQGGNAALAVVFQIVAGSLVSLPLFSLLDRASALLKFRQQPL